MEKTWRSRSALEKNSGTHTRLLWCWFVITASPGSLLLCDWLPHCNLEEVQRCYADTSQGRRWRGWKRERCVAHIDSFTVTSSQSGLPGEIKKVIKRQKARTKRCNFHASRRDFLQNYCTPGESSPVGTLNGSSKAHLLNILFQFNRRPESKVRNMTVLVFNCEFF